MQVVIENWTVKNLIAYEKESTLRVNHEYQRALRWSISQKQMFIDSIFRGYSIPAFYFHKTTVSSGNVFYDIVDGQQRIDAIKSFSEGAFELLDPAKTGFKFPNFMKDDPCPWAGKRFSDLTENLQDRLKNHGTVVYEIETDNENSIRDLFIRLQGGTPLTPQDKRDSWPGKFTEFVLTVGGKSNVDRWYGFPLFMDIAKVTNESKRRSLVAQIFMLHWTIQQENRFCDIKSVNIDEFYHSQVNFDEDSREAEVFKKVCKKLYDIFKGKPKLVGHYLIHLFLFVSQLMEEYSTGWENLLAAKWNEFDTRRQQAATDVKNNKEGMFNEYYHRYGRLTQTQSDSVHTIRRRHAFFVEEMLELLAPEKLDQRKAFSNLERQTVFFRDGEMCQWSQMKGTTLRVEWNDSEIHHVRPYASGGKTNLHNAALVHRDYHPKSPEDVAEFKKWWEEHRLIERVQRGPYVKSDKRINPPDGTKIRFSYKDKMHDGEYRNAKIFLHVNGRERICTSLSGASKVITETARSGWRDWYFLLPGQNQWVLADDWRSNQLNPT